MSATACSGATPTCAAPASKPCPPTPWPSVAPTHTLVLHMTQVGRRSPHTNTTFRIVWYGASGTAPTSLGKTASLPWRTAHQVRDAYVALASQLGCSTVFVTLAGRWSVTSAGQPLPFRIPTHAL